ncbi:C-factor-like [Sphaerodactylus townsendi]|uniref:C-factor-like n=1 Tax=Sphaerodactylus townsendi TaxID=933632 RepID=UPI0020269C1E|nr:C-factor-like [Sphaerodactylus townsendi]
MAGETICNVLVTGANRGIGLELVKQFLGLPNPPKIIFATCRDPQDGRAQELKKLACKHPNLVILKLELTNEETIKAAAKEVEARLAGKGLNLLMNNAGIMPPSTLESMTKEDMLSVYNTDLVGPMLVTKAFLPLVKAAAKQSKEKGFSCCKAAIINTSTIGSSMGNPPSMNTFPVISYRCAKAALNMLTRCQALEYKEDGILCAAIHPGWVKTDMGTEKAELTVEESARGILKTLSKLSEEHSGRFLNWKGDFVAW